MSVPSGGAGATPSDELGNEYISGMTFDQFNEVLPGGGASAAAPGVASAAAPGVAFERPKLMQRLSGLNAANTTPITPAQLETLKSLLRKLGNAIILLEGRKNKLYETDFTPVYNEALTSKANTEETLKLKINPIAIAATRIYHYELLILIARYIITNRNIIESSGSFVAKQQLLQDAIRSLQTTADPPAGCLSCSKRASTFPTAIDTIPTIDSDIYKILYEDLKNSIQLKNDLAKGKRLIQELMQKILKSRFESITGRASVVGGKRRNRKSKKTKRSKKLRTRRHR